MAQGRLGRLQGCRCPMGTASLGGEPCLGAATPSRPTKACMDVGSGVVGGSASCGPVWTSLGRAQLGQETRPLFTQGLKAQARASSESYPGRGRGGG